MLVSDKEQRAMVARGEKAMHAKYRLAFHALLFAGIVCSWGPPSEGSVIAGTYISTISEGGGAEFNGQTQRPPQYIAQGLYLPVSAEVSVAEIVVGMLGDQSFSLQFTNAIGPSATAENVLADGSFNAVRPPIGEALFTLPLYRTLGPGEYYLVVSSTESYGYLEWQNAGHASGLPGVPPYEPLPDTLGTVDPTYYAAYDGGADVSFPPGSVWSYQIGGRPLQFQVLGVPEPSTLSIFVFGVLGVAALGWHKRKRAEE